MTLLRIVLVVLASVCLLAVGAWVAADHYATRVVADGLSERGLSDLVEVQRVRLPLPGLLRLNGVNLRDPRTGEIVAHLDEVEAHFAGGGLGALRRPMPDWVVGRGGRLTLARTHGDLSIVRAVDALLEQLKGPPADEEPPVEAPEEAPREPPRLPRIEFEDVEALLSAPGEVLQSVPGCRGWLDVLPDGVQLNATTGTGGQIALRFGDHGLSHVEVRRVPVTPTHMLFLPDGGDSVRADVQPSGLLDLELEVPPDGWATGHGVLQDARVTFRDVPFPLEHARVPFEFGGGAFRVRNATVALQGGTLTTSVERTETGSTYLVDVVDARFLRQYLDLIPQAGKLQWLRPEDGGNVEVHLQIVDRDESEEIDIRGWGGVLCDHVRFGPTGVDVTDLVGSFDLHGDRLLLHETSGRLAGGGVRLRGSLDLRTADIDVSGSVFDVDVSRLRGQLDPATSGPSPVTGWLQGELRLKGNIDAPKENRGEGQFSVRGGNLFKVPVLTSVFAALRVVAEDAQNQRLEVQYRVRGQRYYVDSLRLQSTAITLLGTGRVSRAGAVNVDIIPISLPLGPLSSLWEYLQSQFVKVEVRGTLDEPEVSVLVVKAVTKPLSRLWAAITGSSTPAEAAAAAGEDEEAEGELEPLSPGSEPPPGSP